MLYAFPDICRMGLGNKLLVWARAEAFAHDHGARVLKPDFFQFPSVGAFLRHETSLRTNLGNFYFKGTDYVSGIRKWMLIRRGSFVDEKEWTSDIMDGIVRFHGLGNDSFGVVLRHHSLIVKRLKAMTDRKILKSVEALTAEPFIGVHIRRGDFKQAGVLTSDEWFATAIRHAVDLRPDLDVIRVFSDASYEELGFLAQIGLPQSKRLYIECGAKPLHDIWCLSRSSIMIGSSRSSFSIWAVLLGQMPSIWATDNAPGAKDLYLPNSLDPIII